MNNNIDSTIRYGTAFSVMKSIFERGILELEVCNNALIGIAKELGVLNPVLL